MPHDDNTLWADVDGYICDLLVDHDSALAETVRSSEAADLPPISVPPNQGKLLNLLARMRGARTILELGTLGGYSTVWLARALPADGSLVTVEADPERAALAGRNIDAAGLSGLVDIRVGSAAEVLAAMVDRREGPFDFIFLDADKQSYPRYLELSIELSHPGTVIVGDNVVRRGELANEASTDESVRGVQRFLEMLAADDRIDATAIQTVGTKGHDGFALAVVNGQAAPDTRRT